MHFPIYNVNTMRYIIDTERNGSEGNEMAEFTYNKNMKAWTYTTDEYIAVISNTNNEDNYYSYVIYTNDEKHEAVYSSVEGIHKEYFCFAYDAVIAAKDFIDIAF